MTWMPGPVYRAGQAQWHPPSHSSSQPSRQGVLATQAEESKEDTSHCQTPGVFPHICSPNSFVHRHVPSFIDGESMPRPCSQSGHLSALRGPAPDSLRGSERGRQDTWPQCYQVPSCIARFKCSLTQAVLTGLEVYIFLLVLSQLLPHWLPISQTQASLVHTAPVPAHSKKQSPFAQTSSPKGQWKAEGRQKPTFEKHVRPF